MNGKEAKDRELGVLRRTAAIEATNIHTLGHGHPRTKRVASAVDKAWNRALKLGASVYETSSAVLEGGQQAGRIMRKRGISL